MSGWLIRLSADEKLNDGLYNTAQFVSSVLILLEGCCTQEDQEAPDPWLEGIPGSSLTECIH